MHTCYKKQMDLTFCNKKKVPPMDREPYIISHAMQVCPNNNNQQKKVTETQTSFIFDIFLS